jgi:hypothetical protein
MRSLRLLVVVVLAVVLALSAAQNAFALTVTSHLDAIYVYKVTTNGDTTTLFHFTLTSSGGQVVGTTDLAGGTSHQFTNIVPDMLVLKETVPSGWALTKISCGYISDVVSVGGNVFAAGSLGVASYEPADLLSTWTVNLADHSVTITLAEDDFVGCTFTNARAPAGAPVGGFMEPVNKLAVFAPYLALFGVLAVVVIAAGPWKKRGN